MLGEATDAEQQQVLEWIAKTDENYRYYNQLLNVWERSKIIEAKSTISENEAWKRFQQKVQGPATPAPVIPLNRHFKLKRWGVAAVAVFLVAGAWLLYTMLNDPYTTITAGNTVVTDTLSDGSVVTLNKNATVSFKKSFNNSIREVTLDGEAFFTVAGDKSRPFVITTGDNIGITVLGTSFNVKNAEAATEVIVESGMVEVRYKQQAVRLNRNEKVTITKSKVTFSKQENKSELYNHYRTHTFICNATPLSELVAKLNEVYQAGIVIGNSKIANLQLTTTFHDASLDSIINIICKTLDITARKAQNRIILE